MLVALVRTIPVAAMLSILIPEYNYDCSALVGDLRAQAERLRLKTGADYEIIVGDDASDDVATTAANSEACGGPRCRFVRNPVNFGRARNRNMMARMAKGDFLLFIDCDAEVCDGSFLARYAEAAVNGDVVCGGISSPAELPSADVKLRYKYERNARKVRSVAYRLKNPYAHFSTFNFMIRRQLFLGIMFDENCVEYGYEDALFGLRLKQEGIRVGHIDNPLVHVGMDTNGSFVDKCEQAMRTLKRLGADMKSYSHVGRIALKLKRWHLVWAVKAWHLMFGRLELANLRGKRPLLFVLKIYKLGYFCRIGGVD